MVTIAETFESLRLGVNLKHKQFAPAIVEALLTPQLVSAANKLLSASKYDRWMRDAAAFTGKYLMNSSDEALESFRDDPNLQVLSMNASWSIDAMRVHSLRPILSPVHEHEELLKYAVTRLRELQRFETVSPEKFADMYTVTHHKTIKGGSAGIIVTRNVNLKPTVKAIAMHEENDVVLPLAAYDVDPYVPILNDMAMTTFGGSTAQRYARVIGQGIITRGREVEGKSQALAIGMGEEEVFMLAIANATELVASADVGPGAVAIHFGVPNGAVYTTGPS